MGFSIYCNGVAYSCGYTAWMIFREEIAKASMDYLREKFTEIMFGEPEYSYTWSQLKKIMEHHDLVGCVTVPDFLDLFSNMDFLNTFIHYDLGGVFALLNKSDDDGYYTAGNALDISQTLAILEKYVASDEIKSQLPDIKKVFYESVNKRMRITLV